jgi:glycosyltransferase involved in cell wall biosynthesis
VPRVSIIVPAHNSSAHLAAAIRSIQAQTYGDWEAIVADDASEDQTFEIASSFGGRIRAVRSERNLGPAGARNLALASASGELIALLDADDVWLPMYLGRQVDRLDRERSRGRKVALVGCDASVEDGGRGPSRTFLDQVRAPAGAVTLEALLRANCIFVSALVVRAAGDHAGWFSPELYGTEDHDLWIRIMELGYEAVINREVLVTYRQVPGSVSSNLARMGANNQLTYRRALDRGRLKPAQRRVARSQLRYNRAMEAFASAWFDGNRLAAVRQLPTLTAVVLGHPRLWRQWFRAAATR